MSKIKFIDRTERIDAIAAKMSDEDRASVAELQERARQETRAYQMQLAAIREAGHLTQAEIARRLAKPQSNVSRTEKATDMLYSSLLAYLEAAGAEDVALTATVAGQRIEVALADAV